MANALKSPKDVKHPEPLPTQPNNSSSTVDTTTKGANATTTPKPKTTKKPATPKPMPKPDKFLAEKKLLTAIGAAASIYWNYTGTTKCLNISDSDDIGADMWEYQVQGSSLELPVLIFEHLVVLKLFFHASTNVTYDHKYFTLLLPPRF